MNLFKLFKNFQISKREKQWQRWQTMQETDITINTRQGHFTFSSHDVAIGQYLYTTGEYQEDDLDRGISLIRQHNYLKSGYVLDIGANIGTVAIKLTRDGTFSRALAFEPETRNFSYLKKNIEQNNLKEKVIAHQIGLSAHVGEMEFELAENNGGDHRIRINESHIDENRYGEAKRATIKIPVKPLDNILQELHVPFSDVALMHMDVQGHEWFVLQGAKQLIEIAPPIIMELWPYGLKRSNTPLEEMFEFLSARYTTLYDLKSSDFMKRPIQDIFSIYADLKDLQHTDILLLK